MKSLKVGTLALALSVTACAEVVIPTYCEGDFQLADAEQLADAKNCYAIHGDLEIAGVDMAALQDLHISRIDGRLTVLGNDALQSFVMPQLWRVDGDVFIIGNQALEDFDLQYLASIGGDLVVNHDHALTDVRAFARLRSVEGSLRIGYLDFMADPGGNDALETLTGLGALDHVGGSLTIENNARLPESEARALHEQLIESGFDGKAFIGHNREQMLVAPPDDMLPVGP